ncbi:MAG TPA: hypothetical protein VJU61_14330 [Polyangiaceae bacterium]|nr:hypothetical protein [Polyangiaceae bacterium]
MIGKLPVLGFSLATALSGQALAHDDCTDGSKGPASYRAPAGYSGRQAPQRFEVRNDGSWRSDGRRGDLVDLRQSDLNRDGRVTMAEALQHGRQDFRRTDRDHDRVLTRYELPRHELTQEDRDRNGRISYQEHQAAVRWDFARYDLNRDGVLGRYELTAPHATRANWQR